MASKKGSGRPKGKGKGKAPAKGRGASPTALTHLDVKNLLVDEFGPAILEFEIRDKGKTKVLEFSVPREKVFPICKFLHENGFEHCSLITAVDQKDRFDVVYHITSYENTLLAQMTVQLPREAPEVESVASIWGGADWNERETWELMGINFIGHPKLENLLLPKDFVGHPQRKDYKEVP